MTGDFGPLGAEFWDLANHAPELDQTLTPPGHPSNTDLEFELRAPNSRTGWHRMTLTCIASRQNAIAWGMSSSERPTPPDTGDGGETTRPHVTPADRWVKPEEAAQITGISVRTLARYRRDSSGPKFSSPSGGAMVRYRVSDLHAWMESHAVAPTEEPRSALR